MKKFSILITTKNRLEDLKYTLQKIKYLIDRYDVECIICDDGSTDETFQYVAENFPKIQLIQHHKSKGLIYSRNKLLNLTKATYAISLDDDSNFVSENSLEIIQTYFEKNPKCAVIASRVFWGEKLPKNLNSNEKQIRVKGFVGCGHIWNMKAWNQIPNYPSWFIFYGEEDFAAFQLFKKGWEVHYVPEILVHHRVNIKERKKDKDYVLRLRRSFRSGWYLYFLFYPWKYIPRKMIYTLWIQLKTKVIKGDIKVFYAISLAVFDVILNFPRLISNSNRFTEKEFLEFLNLPETKFYWNPDKHKI